MPETPDRIVIVGIRGIGHHGVFDHERRDGQEFAVDVDLEVGTATAAASDDLTDTVDYGHVATAVHALITGEPVDLIETLAERIANACLGFAGVRRVHVTVHKPSAPIPVPFDDVRLVITRTRPTDRPVVLALGSNLGDSATLLQRAVDDLAAVPGLRLTAASKVYRTAPVGGPQQPDYLNAVVVGTTTLDPLTLLTATQAVEQAHHRVREIRWGPRTLDIDIVALGSFEVLEVDEPSAGAAPDEPPRLQIPHPRAHERAFVLIPWLDADPHATLVGHGSVEDLVARVDTADVTATETVLRLPPDLP